MLPFSAIQDFKTSLLSLWQPEMERCGVILQGVSVEKPNRSPAPNDNFEFLREDLEGTEATWHTHPSGQGNLSIADYGFFKSWPSHLHFIISETEVRCYGVVEATVRNVDDQEDYSAWLLGQAAP